MQSQAFAAYPPLTRNSRCRCKMEQVRVETDGVRVAVRGRVKGVDAVPAAAVDAPWAVRGSVAWRVRSLIFQPVR